MVVGVLLEGELVGINDRSFGWMIKEKVNHDRSMMKSHGFGLSCGMSLRRGEESSFSSLKG